MNSQVFIHYVIFAIITLLIGLLVCELICFFNPGLKRIHVDDNKYLCISVLLITGFVLKYLLNMKYIQ